MTYTRSDFDIASQHVTEAEARISGQRRLITRFRRLGYGTVEEQEPLTDYRLSASWSRIGALLRGSLNRART